MAHWNFWEWTAYSALFIAASIIAADTGFKLAPSLMEKLPAFFHSAWWGFSPLVFIFLATVILIGHEFGWLGSREIESAAFVKWPDPYSPVSVIGKTFRNEKVELDGHSYSNCEFYNVTFVYNGTTPIQLTNNRIYGFVVVNSENNAVTGTFELAIGFNWLKEHVKFNVPAGTILERGRVMDKNK